MKKQKGLYVLFLIVIGIFYGIQSFGQTGYKTVPDSLVCITPKQDIFLLEKVFEAKEYKTSYIINTDLIAGLEEENTLLNSRITEKDNQINLSNLQTNNCLEENRYLSKQLKKSNRQKQLLKIGFVSVSIVAVLELGYISLFR